VALHEICHMFGLGHCIFFKCLMNGTACLQENELRPPHLCPICLHKLQLCIGFDLVVRFQELRQPNPHFVFVRCDSIRAVPFALLVPAVCAFV
jgi:archaemetzincin